MLRYEALSLAVAGRAAAAAASAHPTIRQEVCLPTLVQPLSLACSLACLLSWLLALIRSLHCAVCQEVQLFHLVLTSRLARHRSVQLQNTASRLVTLS